jgi:isopenicillin-N epimerase
MASQPAFGRDLRPLWHLAPGATFLNHGSYGACPRSVLAEQERLRLEMESHPDRFFRKSIMPRADDATALREAIAPLARFVGAAPDAVAMMENATSGVEAVLRSVPLARGDEVLITDHTYNAVRLIVEARCAETGAKPRVVTLGLAGTAGEIVERFRTALTPQVRLAIVDHITSATALVHPLGRIAAELRRWDAKVLVDGAHGVGHVPLDLDALGADWYVSNAHKWLFAPKGTAFMHAHERVRAMTRPLVVSHFVEMGFPRSFDYVATRDYTGWLALPEALRFYEGLGPDAARAYCARLIDRATGLMQGVGAHAVGSAELACSMRSFVLPQTRPAAPEDAQALAARLWQRDRIQSMAVVFADKLVLRVSAQVYVGEEDVEALAQALERDGWPGRA